MYSSLDVLQGASQSRTHVCAVQVAQMASGFDDAI